MKKIFVALLLLTGFYGFGQSIGRLRYDSVIIEKVGGTAELVLKNSTKDTLGFLYNFGNGRTGFKTIPASSGSGGITGAKNIGSAFRVFLPDSSGWKTFNFTSPLAGDTLTTGQINVKINNPMIIDTSAGIHGQVPIWDGAGNFHTGGSSLEGVFEYTIGSGDVPVVGDSILYNTSFSGKYLIVEWNGQFCHNGYNYTLSHDTITFHPGFTTSDHITIYTSTATPPSISSEASRSWTDLTFGTVSNISASSRVWTSSTTVWNGHGLDAHSLTADGSFQAKYQASDGVECVLGWNTTNADQDYTNYEYGVYLATGGALYRVVNGTPTTLSVTISLGDYYRLNRVGSTVKIQTSTNGNIWTDRYTFAATTSATLYYNLNVNATGKCYYPRWL